MDEAGIGGQARSSSLIRNYLGFSKGISGSRLAEHAIILSIETPPMRVAIVDQTGRMYLPLRQALYE